VPNQHQAEGQKQPSPETIPSDFTTRTEEAKTGKGIVEKNPLSPELQPGIPFTKQERDDEIAREWERNPYLTWDQINARVNENEARMLAAPKAYREQIEHLKKVQDEVSNLFDKKIQTILQKQGPDVFGDLTGSTLLNIKKAMYNDLATDPTLTAEQAAEKWGKKGNDLVKIKNDVRVLANRDRYDRWAPSKKEEAVKKLKEAQKRYEEMGLKDEFFDMLRSNNKKPTFTHNEVTGERSLANTGTFGFGLSPGGAALIAYPRSDNLKKVEKENPFKAVGGQQTNIPQSRKLSQLFAKNRTASDSILAFAKELKMQSGFFDEVAFFDYLRENQDDFNFTPEQKNELLKGISDMAPNWGDIALFPYFGRSKAHD